jgi:hypothetical protein
MRNNHHIHPKQQTIQHTHWKTPKWWFSRSLSVVCWGKYYNRIYNAFAWKKDIYNKLIPTSFISMKIEKTLISSFAENLPNQLCCPQSNSFLIFFFNSLAFLHQSLSTSHSTPPKMQPTKPQ